jgi:hypothetical protein
VVFAATYPALNALNVTRLTCPRSERGRYGGLPGIAIDSVAGMAGPAA